MIPICLTGNLRSIKVLLLLRLFQQWNWKLYQVLCKDLFSFPTYALAKKWLQDKQSDYGFFFFDEEFKIMLWTLSWRLDNADLFYPEATISLLCPSTNLAWIWMLVSGCCMMVYLNKLLYTVDVLSYRMHYLCCFFVHVCNYLSSSSDNKSEMCNFLFPIQNWETTWNILKK